MNFLETGFLWLSKQQKQFTSSGILYVRGEKSFKLNAGFGRTKYETSDDYGLKIAAFSADFLVAASDLQIVPKAGDRIVADGISYEVLELGDECWRWCDPHHITKRIHTKQIS